MTEHMPGDIPPSVFRHLMNDAQTLFAPQGEELAAAISNLKTRYKDIFESPGAYVEKIRLHLDPEYLGTDGVLDELFNFTFDMDLRKLEEHMNILITLVENGLLAVLVDFILKPALWKAYDERKMSYLQLGKLLACAGYILRSTSSEESVITPFVVNIFDNRAAELVTLIRTLWQRRHDFPQDPDYVPSARFRRSRNDSLGGGVFSLILVIEELCSRHERFLFDISSELEPLIFYSWSKTYYPPENGNGLLLKLLGIVSRGTRRDPSRGRNGLTMLLNDPDDARDMAKICLWSLRKGIVDETLGNILATIMRLVECCPDNIYIQLKPYWVQMVSSITRACERQCCQGTRPAHEIILPCALSVLDDLLRPGAPVSAFILQGRGSLAYVDLLPLAARCSPYAVVDDSIQQYSRHVVAVLVALRAEAVRCTRAQDTRMLRKLHKSASTNVPTALRIVNAVSANNSRAMERKRNLMAAWRSYAAALNIRNPMSDEAVEEPSGLHPWTICAWGGCICHVKKAGHRLRVCKGCWQAYYCDTGCQLSDWTDGDHQSVCSRIRAATGADRL